MSTSTDTTPLSLVAEELRRWPPETEIHTGHLAERLRWLSACEDLDEQEVAWILDIDGRYGDTASAWAAGIWPDNT
jgi:hypothetical protein